MSDVSRYLPLSQRRREDESRVTSDWRAPFAAILNSLADTLQALPADGWRLETIAAAGDVRGVVGHLVWRLTAPRFERSAARVRRVRVDLSGLSTAELTAALRTIAAVDRKRRIGDLSAATVGALDVAYGLDRAGIAHDIVVEPMTLGAVALARSLSAPLPVRAVLGDLTLVASPGDWRVGRGPLREAAASDIVLFLFGRLGVPVAMPAEPDRHEIGDYDKGEQGSM